MENYRIKILSIAASVIFFVFLFNSIAIAQENDADNFRMLFYFNTTKNADSSRLLEVKFIARNKENKKDKVAIVAAPIVFYMVAEEEELLLGKADTGNDGIAGLVLPSSQKYIKDEEGYITFLARFEGTDALDEEEEELMILDLELKLDLAIEDSVKMAFINAFTLDSIAEKIPVEELEIIVGVEGMLSVLTLEEGDLEAGEYEMEMPDGIPGDVHGDLIVHVIVDEHDDFGTVIQKQKVNWGSRNEEVVVEKNKLWTDAAPIWMYVVLTIMLLGVWANYVYTIINLKKIKKMGI